MICPNCGTETEEPKAPVLLKIGGKPQKIVKRTDIKKRYIPLDDREVMYCKPIPLLIVREA